jgi:hypothetical protein
MLSGYQHVLYKGIVVAFLALATLSQTATGEGDFFILVRCVLYEEINIVVAICNM